MFFAFYTVLLRTGIGAWIIYGIAAFIAFYGKRMMWLSSQWVGGVAMNRQINFLALIQVISIILAYLLAKLYLSIYPIQHSFILNN